MVVGTALHYGDALPVLSDAADNSPVSLAYRQSLERILFLLPVMYAAYVFGLRGGLGTLAAAGAILLPRALMGSELDHCIPEVAGVMVVGALLTLLIVQQQGEMAAQKRTHESLGYFVRQVLTAQEDERNRIALELHDDTAQSLLVICQRLDGLTQREDRRLPAGVAGELEGLRAALVRTLADLRRLSQGLRPRILDHQGLEAALDWLADQLMEEYGTRIRVDVSTPLSGYAQNTQLILFRIAQEALRNVARHSGASEAVISVRGDGERLTMTVTDDGRGFVVPPTLSDLAGTGRLGLAGMSERVRLLGGVLSIRSILGVGSIIEIKLPRGAAGQPSGAAAADHPAMARASAAAST
ncbi:MAG: sensor histidine kinase [Chloroflexi bacterium]|nr:sensor histidine kinase [Chloroflexota bacterium]